MPKRGLAALAITTVALVLLLSFKTPDEPLPGRSGGTIAAAEPKTATELPNTATQVPRTSPAPGSPAPGASGSASTPIPAPTAASGDAATTVDGPVVSTEYGPIQVQVVVAGGRIQDIVALQLPSGRRSGRISQYSEPILRDEALQAQSASIDLVSGATYTSDAYAQSLQAALDQVGLG